MIKIENVQICGWEPTIRGMRNSLNSWAKSDSGWDEHVPPLALRDKVNWDEYAKKYEIVEYDDEGEFAVGPNDKGLMERLAKGGPAHAKYRRFITVYLDIVAPIYWWSEFDTYKIGTDRNSCSFMHKGVSRPFTIDDFSIKNEKIYDILRPLEKKEYKLSYPYETDEFKIYTDENGRTYRVYRNGRVIQEAYTYVDNYGRGRTRTISEQEAQIYQIDDGYFVVKLAGRTGKHIPLHDLIAKVWCSGETKEKCQVDHLNGDKGDNSAENLEWVTPSENMKRAIQNGLYDNLDSIHKRYRLWKYHASLFPVEKRMEFKMDYEQGMTCKELAEKYGITYIQANNVRYGMKNSDVEEDFQEALIYDRIIEKLNELRHIYLETKDNKIFQEIRSILPSGYMQRSTIKLNYETLYRIYHDRKGHKLDEWNEFCKWIESLPLSEVITGAKVEEKEDSPWIPCTDENAKMPEEGEEVLCTLKEDWSFGEGTDIQCHVFEGMYKLTKEDCFDMPAANGKGYFETCNDWAEGQPLSVIAWMPKPEAYKE